MNFNIYNIPIPKELKNCLRDTVCPFELASMDYGLNNKIHYHDNGTIDCIDVLDEKAKLTKKIYYDGAQVVKINYFHNNARYKKEDFNNSCLYRISYYYDDGTLQEEVKFNYNNKAQVIAIKKRKNGKEFLLKYGYDELNRVNARKFFIDADSIIEQEYCFDILDRVASYNDQYHNIIVHKIGSNNEFIHYTITDKKNNCINIKNNFVTGEYINTIVTINGQTTKVQNKNYVDNVMLKKPMANEDDLNFMVALFFKPINLSITKRVNIVDVLTRNSNDIISQKVQINILPIAMRKHALYEQNKQIYKD